MNTMNTTVCNRNDKDAMQCCKILFLGPLPIHLFRHFCGRLYRLL